MAQDRLAMPVDQEGSPKLPFAVVGIGASAGGLEAYMEFLQHMPPESGMAFVLVQHLSPKHESMVAEILQKHTEMRVQQVEDGMRVEPNHVYIIRPGHTMTIRDGALRLGESLMEPTHRRPVDDFFRSLAQEQRERGIAILMSGMGSNGTSGAQAIKAVGGMCIAQDPDTAKFNSMPLSVIDAGLADFIFKPQDMPDALIKYAAHPYTTGQRATRPKDRETNHLGEVLTIVRARTKNDFSGYKKPTLLRRIERRMGLNQLTSVPDYVRMLRQSPGEVTALSDDIMIHVTGFFRDAQAWDTLYRQVLLPMAQQREDESTIRCWVAACSSGEEAYTLAILLMEASDAVNKRFDIKIFATDTAERSLGQARHGQYPGGIESEISPERLERFFEKNDAFYRVRKELRDVVVFAPQNVLQDPPFSKLDLVTCRNLLIYLEPGMQERVLSLLHFGLKDGAVLMLGNSETILAADDMYEQIDKKSRIYRRVGQSRQGRVPFPRANLSRLGVEREPTESRFLPRQTLAQMAHKSLLETQTPASVIVDRSGKIVYYHGRTDRFLNPPQGEPTRDLLMLANEHVRAAVRAAMQQVLEANAPIFVRDGFIIVDGTRQRVDIAAAPLEGRASSVYFLISFLLHPEPAAAPIPKSGNGDEPAELQEELNRVRDELQSTIEELQTSNEEMKASNEEVTSINEELQSTNEELETSKEELQSLNEELSTVNSQLQQKMDELEHTGNDLGCLLSSIDIAVIFLDPNFRVRRYTQAVKDLVDLIPSDVGRPLSDLKMKFSDPALAEDCRTVLEKLVPMEAEVGSHSGRHYARRVLPYRTQDNRIDGVVITFVDVTARRNAEAAQHEAEERLRQAALARGLGDWQIELPSRKLNFSPETLALLGLPTNINVDYPVFQSVVHPADREKLEKALQDALQPKGEGYYTLEFRVIRADKAIRWVEARGRTTFATGEGGREATVMRGTMADITALRAADLAATAKDDFLANVSHELRTPVAATLLWTKLLLGDLSDSKRVREGILAIHQSARSQQTLINDLLDTTRSATGKLRLEPKLVELASVVRSAIDHVSSTAENRGVELITHLATDLGIVRADPTRVQQVLWNLLSNAVKFTPPNGRVQLHVQRRGADVEFRVTDTGQGIAPEFLPGLFQRFSQAGLPPMAGGGLGLGLAITRQLVELHGGTIAAHSQGIGKGSTFTIVMPLPLMQGHADQDAPTGSLKGCLKDKRVLLVEDDALTQIALIATLQRAGADVEAVDSIELALHAVERKRPDVILSDIGLADGSGNELICKVRQSENGGTPPAPRAGGCDQRLRPRTGPPEGADQRIRPIPVQAGRSRPTGLGARRAGWMIMINRQSWLDWKRSVS